MTIKNVYEKLQNCRVELQESKLKKSGKNSYSGFEYFELQDFMPTVNKLFEKHKLFSNFSLFTVNLDRSNNASLVIVNVEDKNDFVEFCCPSAELELKGCNKIQALGGTITYLKRYLYMNALEIVENDSFDAVVGKTKEVEEKPTVDYIELINNCTEMASLVKIFNENQAEFKGNAEITNAFKVKKAELLKVVNNANN